jgi:hypothetical protein
MKNRIGCFCSCWACRRRRRNRRRRRRSQLNQRTEIVIKRGEFLCRERGGRGFDKRSERAIQAVVVDDERIWTRKSELRLRED